MQSVESVCLSVCPCVRISEGVQDNSISCGRIRMIFSEPTAQLILNLADVPSSKSGIKFCGRGGTPFACRANQSAVLSEESKAHFRCYVKRLLEFTI